MGLLLAGLVSFVEADDKQEAEEGRGELAGICSHSYFSVFGFHWLIYAFRSGDAWFLYKVDFSLELICQPAAPLRTIDVQCSSQVIFENRPARVAEILRE